MGTSPSMGAMLRETWASYQRHNTQWIAAALAYFATFAIAPLIIVVVELAGLFLHNHREVLDAIYAHMPVSSAKAVEAIVDATFSQRRSTVIAQVAGWAVFVLAAMGLFGSLQYALNTVWDVTPAHLNILQTIRRRAVGFVMMLVAAALLILSVVATAGLTAAATYLSHLAPGSATLAKAGDFVITFALVWLLFAMLFEYLPDTPISWRDVWLGAGITSLLFVGGQFLLGWYLGRAGVTSAYGAFGSLVVFLLWANYSAQIVLVGAEFTHVYALHRTRQVS